MYRISNQSVMVMVIVGPFFSYDILLNNSIFYLLRVEPLAQDARVKMTHL